MLQQGDVLITKISSLPEGKRVSKSNRGYVIAEGEATGHAHVIDDEITMIEKDGTLYIGCDKDVTIKHEEHGHINIPVGCYKIGYVREYDHFAEEARRVQD